MKAQHLIAAVALSVILTGCGAASVTAPTLSKSSNPAATISAQTKLSTKRVEKEWAIEVGKAQKNRFDAYITRFSNTMHSCEKAYLWEDVSIKLLAADKILSTLFVVNVSGPETKVELVLQSLKDGWPD